MTKTYVAKKEDVQPDWYVVDADAQVVGRLASRLATVLMGKHKPTYTPHVDCGDYVVVVNVEKVRFTGVSMAHPRHPYYTKKMANKTYEDYSGYPGGLHIRSAMDVWEKNPERILYDAVRRMLPKNKLGRQMLSKLKLYTGPHHPHQAQQPQDLPDYV